MIIDLDKECNDEDDRLGFFRFASEKSRQRKSQSAIQDQVNCLIFVIEIQSYLKRIETIQLPHH